MIKVIFTSFFYLTIFAALVYFISPMVGFSQQEINLLYLFVCVVIYAGLIAPKLEETIEKHNERASHLVDSEHSELQKKLDSESIEK